MPRVYVPRMRGDVPVPYHIIGRTGTWASETVPSGRPALAPDPAAGRRWWSANRPRPFGGRPRHEDEQKGCGMVTQLNPSKATVEEAPVEATEEQPGRAPFLSIDGLVRGVDVRVRNGLVGAVMAADDVHLERGFVRSVYAGGGLQIRQGGSGLIVSGGDAHIERAGAQAILSAGSITMESAGSGFAVARRIRVAQGGTAVFAITPDLEVHEGGRVLFGRGASIAIVGAIWSLVALAAYLVRRRSSRAA
jgi:hypothetical protein